MPGFVDTVIESFKQTLDLRLWLYFFLTQVVEAVVSAAAILVFVLLAFAAIFGSAAFANIQNIAQLFSSPSFILNALGAILLLAAILFLMLLYISSFFTGLRFNLFNRFLQKKELDLGAAFEETKPRTLTYFKINLLISGIVLLLAALLLLPVLLPMLAGQLLSGSAAAGALAYFLLVFLLALVFAVAVFFLSPVLLLLAPVAFFSRLGVIASIERSIELVRANYWGNLAFVLIYLVIAMGVSWAVSLVGQIAGLLAFIPAIAVAGGSSMAAGPGILGAMLSYYTIFFVIFIPYVIWSAVFSTACFRNLYFLDTQLLGKRKHWKKGRKPTTKPKRKARRG